MARILIIEDDPAIADVLDRGFRAEGYEADIAHSGADGFWRAKEGAYAAIVLDLLMPGMNGYNVCREIRAANINTPILVLTAKTGEHDQIDLLELGADDFVSKPATVAMLIARIRALLRRSRTPIGPTYSVGSMIYNESTRICSLDGEAVELTAREQSVLVALLRADGFVARDDLVRIVWGLDFDGDPGIVDVYLGKLRAKLGKTLIENRRGIGYRLANTSASPSASPASSI